MPPKHADPAAMMMGDDDAGFDMMQGLGGGAALEKYLDVNFSAKFMSELPERIRQRAEVLLHYQTEQERILAEIQAREMELRRKHEALFEPIFARRREIVTGAAEPTDEEVRRGFPEEHAGKVTLEGEVEAVRGLPGFWLRVLKHHVGIDSMIQEWDEAVLEHLIDITSRTAAEGGNGSIDVVFTFAPNDYIVEEKLTISVRAEPSEAPNTIVRGPLTWKEGKNVTVEVVEKKQKAKKTGQTRVVRKEVPRFSFFTMFTEKPKGDDDDDDGGEEEEENDEEQVEAVLRSLHQAIVPGAVNHYTGEAPDGSDDIDVDDDEEEEEEEEEEEDYAPMRGRGRGRGRGRF